MKILTVTSIVCVSLLQFSCEDKFYKKKFDVEYVITNRTNVVLREVKIDGDQGTKIWILKNMNPGESERIGFNIKKDLGGPEGNISLTAYLNEKDSIHLSAAYYTNWQYLSESPTKFDIYENKILGKK